MTEATDHLLIVTLGPVQSFIAAARRSRDLWCGSWLLSEVAKAAALALHQAGAELIFPAPECTEDLQPASPLNVANHVLLRLPGHVATPAEAARQARHAAQNRLEQLAAKALQTLEADNTQVRQDLWNAQLADLLEFHAAWAELGQNTYSTALRQTYQALAARKATRDFRPAALTPEAPESYRLPKSSLDGARESVLPELPPNSRARQRLGLADGEQLDCAGVIKRLAGTIDQFTPLTRIAAHPWLSQLTADELTQLRDASAPLISAGLGTRVLGNAGCYADYPYDSQLLYRGQLLAAINRARQTNDTASLRHFTHLQQILHPLWQRYGEPSPYGVILLADGDHMGALLEETSQHATHHLRFSHALSGFAATVRETVRAHAGHAIYAGGDDILAFLPLPSALGAASALAHAFAHSPLAELLHTLASPQRPSLSVGLGIGHVMQPLGELRTLAQRAEALAKAHQAPSHESRNGLGIVLQTRGGSCTQLRLRWDDTAALDSFSTWRQLYTPPQRQLPSSLAYGLRQIHHQTAFALPTHPAIPAAEFKRLLIRATTDTGQPIATEHQAALQARLDDLLPTPTALGQLGDELILARWLAARTATDLGDEA